MYDIQLDISSKNLWCQHRADKWLQMCRKRPIEKLAIPCNDMSLIYEFFLPFMPSPSPFSLANQGIEIPGQQAI